VVQITKSIAEQLLDEAPNIQTVPVSKSRSSIQVLAQKTADEELTEQEQALMLEVFQGAFSQD
jgi:hypothetical protein